MVLSKSAGSHLKLVAHAAMSSEKHRNKRLHRGKTSHDSARVLPSGPRVPASPALGSEAALWALAEELGADRPNWPKVAIAGEQLLPAAPEEEALIVQHPLGSPKGEGRKE